MHLPLLMIVIVTITDLKFYCQLLQIVHFGGNLRGYFYRDDAGGTHPVRPVKIAFAGIPIPQSIGDPDEVYHHPGVPVYPDQLRHFPSPPLLPGRGGR